LTGNYVTIRFEEGSTYNIEEVRAYSTEDFEPLELDFSNNAALK